MQKFLQEVLSEQLRCISIHTKLQPIQLNSITLLNTCVLPPTLPSTICTTSDPTACSIALITCFFGKQNKNKKTTPTKTSLPANKEYILRPKNKTSTYPSAYLATTLTVSSHFLSLCFSSNCSQHLECLSPHRPGSPLTSSETVMSSSQLAQSTWQEAYTEHPVGSQTNWAWDSEDQDTPDHRADPRSRPWGEKGVG